MKVMIILYKASEVTSFITMHLTNLSYLTTVTHLAISPKPALV